MTSVFTRAFKPAAILSIGAGFAPLAMAQASASLCNLSLAYAPVLAQVPAAALPVPTLTVLSLGILSAAVGVVAWSKASSAKKKMLSVAVMGAALGLSALGGNGLVQEVRAAGVYAFSNAQGGVVADAEIAYADPAPVFTISNTTGVKLKIVSNANAQEAGTCVADAELAPGASCTATAVCPTPPVVTPPVVTPPVVTPPVTPPVVTPPLIELKVDAEPTIQCDRTTQRIPMRYRKGDESTSGTSHWTWAYTPLLNTPPVFEPAVTVDVSDLTITPNAQDWVPGSPDLFENLNYDQVISGVGVMTATAPAGYGFGPTLAPTITWSLPYADCGDFDERT